MEIQTYEVEEIKGELGVMAADAEALEIIEKLGLDGQKSLSREDTATRFPYRKITALEHLVLKIICPTETSLRRYSSGPVPLRVLQVAAHVAEMRPNWHLKVWHPEDWRRDPVLLAQTAEYSGEVYLLARWGEVVESLETLVEKAKKIWIAEKRQNLAEIKRQVETDSANLELIADTAFSTGKSKNFTYYNH